MPWLCVCPCVSVCVCTYVIRWNYFRNVIGVTWRVIIHFGCSYGTGGRAPIYLIRETCAEIPGHWAGFLEKFYKTCTRLVTGHGSKSIYNETPEHTVVFFLRYSLKLHTCVENLFSTTAYRSTLPLSFFILFFFFFSQNSSQFVHTRGAWHWAFIRRTLKNSLFSSRVSKLFLSKNSISFLFMKYILCACAFYGANCHGNGETPMREISEVNENCTLTYLLRREIHFRTFN